MLLFRLLLCYSIMMLWLLGCFMYSFCKVIYIL